MKCSGLSVEDMTYIAMSEWASNPKLRRRCSVFDYVADRVFELMVDDIFNAVEREL